MKMHIAPGVVMLGMMDGELDLFEAQYPLDHGVSYNSTVILDERVAVLDTVDARKQDEWLRELEQTLGGRKPDLLIISHMEPDHAGSIEAFAGRYPDATLVGNAKTFGLLDQFTQGRVALARQVVTEGEVLSLGTHTLRFLLAPMVHWPEVMVSFEESEGILFSADAFGRFGSLNAQEPWEEEARRYYANIVGKYGAQVQALLRKTDALPVKMICPLHGPVLTGEAMVRAVELYRGWSSFGPQESGVLVAYASFHGNTAKAALLLADELKARGQKAVCIDLMRTHKSYAVAEALRFDRMALAATTYDGGYNPAMEAFLSALRSKGCQGRTVALMENGSWGPLAAKKMREVLESMKNMRVLEQQVTIRSAMSAANEKEIAQLAQALADAVQAGE